jgi:hypothetical protein
MIKRISKILAAAVLAFGSVFAFGLATANAEISQDVCDGINAVVGDTGNCTDSTNANGESTITSIAKKVVNLLTLIVGVMAVIMIIFGGLKLTAGGGSDKSIKSGKNAILYAIIGLIVVLLAQVIVRFVFTNATGIGDNTGGTGQ